MIGCSPIHIDSKPSDSMVCASAVTGGPNQTKFDAMPSFMAVLSRRARAAAVLTYIWNIEMSRSASPRAVPLPGQSTRLRHKARFDRDSRMGDRLAGKVALVTGGAQ